jgi:5-methyltetrahydropteroyltriglutamate--homocysteine methyltransferase
MPATRRIVLFGPFANRLANAWQAGSRAADATRLISGRSRSNTGPCTDSARCRGDFTLYDHVLDFNYTFNIIPKRFAEAKLSDLDRYFAMGRGHQKDGVDLEAQEMQKWFDSNYHYIKSEVSSHTEFRLNDTKPVDEYLEAKEAGIETRPVLVGPITALLLGKAGRDEANRASFEPISLLDKLVPVYGELLKKLQAAGATEVQIDEPSLVMDSTANLAQQYQATFEALAKAAPGLKITLATYFGRLDKNVEFVAKLPVSALHVDLDRAPEQLDQVLAAVKPTQLKLSLGLVSGRNIWKNDLAASLATAKKAIEALGQDRVVVATSSSLLHTPVTLANESRLSADVKDWFSFATEKAAEVATLAKALSGADVQAALDANKQSIEARRAFEQNSDASVRDRLSKVTPDMYNRKSPFPERKAAQDKVYDLPTFPTTTIGSFPQTKEIRLARSKNTKGELSTEEYEKFLENEIKSAVDFQEAIDIDILVHGEPERNDMSQYFGEQLQGFVFTENAWVQSYGSRYVRPPIIVSDVSRPHPMTVRWSSYAQSLTKRPMKGMLTGPVTILNWSFPRADVSKEVQCKQLALALRDEVCDLAKAGIFAIQVDEPAIREGLPLRQVDWNAYLTWAVDSFKLSTAGVENATQIHSHFCAFSPFYRTIDANFSGPNPPNLALHPQATRTLASSLTTSSASTPTSSRSRLPSRTSSSSRCSTSTATRTSSAPVSSEFRLSGLSLTASPRDTGLTSFRPHHNSDIHSCVASHAQNDGVERK